MPLPKNAEIVSAAVPEKKGSFHAPPFVWIAAVVTTLLGIAVHFVIRQGFLDNMDEVNYLWLADRLLEGRVTAEPLPEGLESHFDVYWRGQHGRRLYTVFPVGWPVLLAAGRAAAVPWLINPLLAGVVVLLTWILVRRLYGNRKVAGRTVILLAPCPFLAFQAGTLLSHVAVLTWLLVASLCLVLAAERKNMGLTLIGGVALGFAASTRQLDALAVALMSGMGLVFQSRRDGRFLAGSLGLLVAGTAIGLAPLLLYNAAVTGEPFLAPQRLYGFPDPLFADSFGTWLSRTLPRTLRQALSWQYWFFPIWVVLLASFLILARAWQWADVLCMSTIAILLGAYSFNVAYYDIAGPRYHMVALVPACILVARASLTLTKRKAIVALCIVLLNYLGIYVWQGREMRKQISHKRTLEKTIEESGLERALVLIPDGWPAGLYARDLLRNAPEFSGIIYALDLPDHNDRLLEHFRGVPVYRWNPPGPNSPSVLESVERER